MFLLIFVLSAVIYGSDSLQDSYLIKKSTSCPAAGYFYEREISINSVGSKNCYICFCNNEIAFCWKHASKRCKKQAMPKAKNSDQANISQIENRIRLKNVNDVNYEDKHFQKRKLARQGVRKPKTTRKRDDLPTASKMNGIVEYYKYGRAFRNQPEGISKRSNKTKHFKSSKSSYKDTRIKLPKMEQMQGKRQDKDKLKEINRRKQLTKLLLKKLSQAILLLSDGDDADNVLRTKKTTKFSRNTETEKEPDALEMYLKHVLESINSTNNHKAVKSNIQKREALDFRMSHSSLEDLLHGGISLSPRNSSTEKYASKQSTTLPDYHTIFDSLSKNTKDSEYYKYTVEEEGKNKTSNEPQIITDNPQRVGKETIINLLKTPKIRDETISNPISNGRNTSNNNSVTVIPAEKPKSNSIETNINISRFVLDNLNFNNDAKMYRNENKFHVKPLTILSRSIENSTEPMVSSVLNFEDKWDTPNKMVIFRNKKQKASKLKRKRKHHMKHRVENHIHANNKRNNKESINMGNTTNKNTFKFMKKLFKHHLFYDKEQNNMFKKINIMKIVCPDQNKCNVSGEKKKKLRPKIKQLNDISNKIYDIIYNIKSQVKLLRNERNMTNSNEVKTVKRELETLDSILRGTFFANNSKNFTYNQIDRIAKIKNGARIFVESVKKFTSTLNYIITLTSSSDNDGNFKDNNVLRRMLRYAESDEKKYKEQIENTLKNIRTLFRKHSKMHNRLLEGLSKIVGRNYDSNNKHKSNMNATEFNKTKKLHNNTSKMDRYTKKIITNLKILKDLAEKMDFHKMRMKRNIHTTMEDSDYYDYLLLMMEFLVKQNNNLIMRNEPPRPKDGIDVLLDAIRNSPDPTIAPFEKKPIKYRTKGSARNESFIEAISSRLASLDEDKERKSYQLRKLFTSIDDSTSSEGKDKDIFNDDVSAKPDFSGDIRFDRAIKSNLGAKEKTIKIIDNEIATVSSISKENLKDEEELLALIRPSTKSDDVETVILSTRKVEEKHDEHTSKDASKSLDKSSSETEDSVEEELTHKLVTTKTTAVIRVTENPRRTTLRDIVRRGQLRRNKDVSIEAQVASAHNVDSYSLSRENYKKFNSNDLFG